MNYAELNKQLNNIKSSYKTCVKKLVDYISKNPYLGEYDAEEIRTELVKEWINICSSESIMLYNFVVSNVIHNYMGNFNDIEIAADDLIDSQDINEISLPDEPSVKLALKKRIKF